MFQPFSQRQFSDYQNDRQGESFRVNISDPLLEINFFKTMFYVSSCFTHLIDELKKLIFKASNKC
jgi:hypothetical protein